MNYNCTSTKSKKIEQIDELLNLPIKFKMEVYSNLKDFFLNLELSLLNDLYDKLWEEENVYIQHIQSILKINDYLNCKDKMVINCLSIKKFVNMDQILESFGYEHNENSHCEIYENDKPLIY